MDTASANPPPFCNQDGLDCPSCTTSTARELARACPSLPAKLVAQLFVQIHTYSACARMHRHFQNAYAEALQPAEPIATRKPVTITTRRLAAAAAA